MKNVFARDEHGNVKRKQPCQTPGCDWPNFHVCLFGKPNSIPDILAREAARVRTYGTRSQSHRDNISLSQLDRWARIKEANRGRDQKIVARYSEGNVSIKMLQREFQLGSRVISNVLSEAAANGEIVLRKPGVTLSRPGRHNVA